MANPTVNTSVVNYSTLRSAMFVSDQIDQAGTATKGAWDALVSVFWPVAGTASDLTPVTCGSTSVNGLQSTAGTDTGIRLAPAANLTTSVWEQYGVGPWTLVIMVRRPTSGAGVLLDNIDYYGSGYGYAFYILADGSIQCVTKGPSSNGFPQSAAGTLADGETAVIAAVFDNTGSFKLYKNGTQVAASTPPAGSPTFTGAGDRRASFFDPDAPSTAGAGSTAGNVVIFGALWYSSLLTAANLATFGTTQANVLAGSFYTAAFNGLVSTATTATIATTLDNSVFVGSANPAASSSAAIITTLADAVFSGSAAQQPGTVTTYPFSRNNGFSPVSLPNNALAVLSDDANLVRIAGSAAVGMSAGGTLSYGVAGIVPGTAYIVVTREADGKLGVERYTAT